MISLLKTDERIYLETKIESLRKEMIRIGILEGLTSERTILVSQKLDNFISRYQKMNNY